jgi:hypothetical protein
MARDRGHEVGPPADFHKRKIQLRSITAPSWWRIHRSTLGACNFSEDAGNRFSSRGLGVLYLGGDEVTAFWEIFWDDLATRSPEDRRISRAKLNVRAICTAALQRPAHVFDATDGASLKRVSAPAATFSTSYANCQAWALALFSHPSAPEGILYASARHKTGQCLALFAGRFDCGHVGFSGSVPIADSAAIVTAIATDDVQVIDD